MSSLLAHTLAAESAKSQHVEAAWTIGDDWFVVQAVVGHKNSSHPDHRNWTLIEPSYANAEAMREVNAVADRVKQKHPNVWAGWVVAYVFRPGACATEVYRKSARRAA